MSLGDVESAYADLTEEVLSDVANTDEADVQRSADLRFVGQSFELTVPVDEEFDAGAVAERFRDAHEGAYGYVMDDPIELVNVRMTAVVARDSPSVTYRTTGDAEKGRREAFFDDGFHETPVFDRTGLGESGSVTGHAILEQNESTVVVPPGWSGTVNSDGTLLLGRDGNERRRSSAIDAVTLEIMRNQFEGVAEEMGQVLITSSYSPNIKERRDCSTALFDAEGRLVAQAEHIPVHLGAMPKR